MADSTMGWQYMKAVREGMVRRGTIPETEQLTLGEPASLPEFDRWRVFKQDCVEWLATLPAESVHCVVTDAAYESLEKHRAKGTTTRLKVSDASSNRWFPIFKNERFPSLFAQLYRVMARDSHLYMMCDDETMFVIKPMAEVAGFKFWKSLIWDYGQIGMGYHYRARHQKILFFEKGKRSLNDLGISDVINVKRVNRGYPTEKPVELSEVLIRQSTSVSAIVVDPFMGSGSAGVAAVRSGRRFLGCDVEDHAIELATKNLEAWS